MQAFACQGFTHLTTRQTGEHHSPGLRFRTHISKAATLADWVAPPRFPVPPIIKCIIGA